MSIYDPADTLYPPPVLPTIYPVKSCKDYYAVLSAQNIGIGEIFQFKEGTRGICTIAKPTEVLILLAKPIPVTEATKVDIGSGA